MTDTVNALRAQLQQLESRHREGRLTRKEYQRQRAAIERALLDHVLDKPPGQPAKADDGVARPSRGLVAALVAGVFAVAIGGYTITGSPTLISGMPPVESAGLDATHANSVEQFNAAVDGLAEKLKTQPDNGEGWGMLARSYVQLGRFSDALPAFVKAIELQGDNPGLLTDYADALAVTRDRNLAGEPTQLIERALKLDPDNLKALALAGTAAFNRSEFTEAVRLWERMLKVAPADSPFMPQLKESIAEARQRAGMPAAVDMPQAPVATAAAPTEAAAPAGATPAASATLTGTVRLAPTLRAAPEDTLFVYARPAEGSRMPLAILRKQVKDLPLKFSLDDSLAMSPAARLSLHPKVIIEARVSKSGQAQAGPGDLVARSAPLANDAQGVVIEIAEVVK